jgi:hypothetical protein
MVNKNSDDDLEFKLPDDLKLDIEENENENNELNPVLGAAVPSEKSVTGMPDLPSSKTAIPQDVDTELNNFSQEISKPKDNASTAYLIQNALESVEKSGLNPAFENEKKTSSFLKFSPPKSIFNNLTNIGLIISILASFTAIFLSMDTNQKKPGAIFSKTHESKILENNNNIVMLKNKINALENEIAKLKSFKAPPRKTIAPKRKRIIKRPAARYRRRTKKAPPMIRRK